MYLWKQLMKYIKTVKLNASIIEPQEKENYTESKLASQIIIDCDEVDSNNEETFIEYIQKRNT